MWSCYRAVLGVPSVAERVADRLRACGAAVGIFFAFDGLR